MSSIDNVTKKSLSFIHACFLIGLILLFAIQYIFVKPPDRDYFNVNLTAVSGAIILFSILMMWLSFYNSKKLKSQLNSDQHFKLEDIKEGYLLSWAPLAGACLFCQLVYFHIYGHWSLLVVSTLALITLLFKRDL